ncbi:MAG: hypothetical protein KAR21_14070 [Spirochaetales bacterium]|nr:hypothetical protein [Spirochaetales bacterium]
MTLKEIRKKWEQGRTVLLALSNPNRDKVYVLLQNPYNKNNMREEFSIYEYTKTDNNWAMYINPNFSEFEHLEQGLQYINEKCEKFLPE